MTANNTGKSISGQTFGRLYALRATTDRIHGSIAYYCLCRCGGRAMVAAVDLRYGSRTSCGCQLFANARMMGIENGPRFTAANLSPEMREAYISARCEAAESDEVDPAVLLCEEFGL